MESTSSEQNKKPNEETTLHLKVKSQDGVGALYRAKPTSKLKKLMNDYSNYHYFPVAFFFDGHQIREEDTPESLNMEDGDEIIALIQQTSG
ncbi:hypothetical protein IEQ34_002225 [Dendrobium chrysotoxum]|uniref:Ubiquitin-like domain-containing protein n=1 Tax=Dendrobium chrysotoxum TaxID=161865 RepID=A0AAV7HNB7_DENCH|nr:hypothetical protein IEQ34_002225 [Dendrobium chrysotoxum]